MLRPATLAADDGAGPPPLDGGAARAPARATRSAAGPSPLPPRPTIPDHLLLPAARAARKAAAVLAPSNAATLAAVTADKELEALICDETLAAAVARVRSAPHTLPSEIAANPRLGVLYTRLAAVAGARLEAAAREAAEGKGVLRKQ